MNVTVNSQRLAVELRLLARIVSAKPAIQILSHALLRADDALRLYATDLEVGLSTTCPAQVHEVGTVALPVAKFLAFVEQFPDADVSIALGGHQAVVQCGAFKSRLQTMPVDDFPEPPAVEGVTCVLDAAALGQLIASTRYAVTSGGSKHVLRGALLTLSGPVAAMVATDSKRLALATRSRAGEDATAIVPVKALDVLMNQPTVGDVELTFGARHLFFSANGRLLISRTIDGEYPKYERVIPRANDKVVTVDRDAFAAALRRVTIASEETNAVFLDVSVGSVDLSSSSAEVGSASERVAVEYEGQPLRACVSGRHVLDFLDAASGQIITLALKDARTAMLLTDGSDHLGVIMLMRA